MLKLLTASTRSRLLVLTLRPVSRTYTALQSQQEISYTVTIIISGIVTQFFRFGNYFWYSPVYKPFVIYFILEAIFIGSYFQYSTRRQTFSDLFSKRFYWLFLWVAVSGISPSTNLTLLILVSSYFDWPNHLGTFFRLRTNGEYIYKWAILKTQRRQRNETEKEEGR